MRNQDLTPAEHEVFHRLAQAAPARDIAMQLRVTESTVRTHIRHLQEKLSLSGIPAVTRAAVLHEIQEGCPGTSRPSSE